jgi:carboxypeptidase PM20D1
MFRRLFKPLALLLAIVLAFAFARTIRSRPVEEPVSRVAFAVDGTGAVERFQGALRFETISTADGPSDPAAFVALHDFLKEKYPLVHKTLTRETVGGLSLIYRWPGRDPKKAPIILMGHIDVVPIAPGTEGSWHKRPFEAAVEGDWLYGRGSIDDKSTVIAVLEAVEQLLAEGFVPDRAIILQFGHDEEAGGRAGAKLIVDKLVAEGVKPALVIDEGGAMTSGKALGAGPVIAVVGVAEKGAVSLELSVSGDGGHSSTPPSTTHIGRLARAVATLEANPFPARIDGVAEAMFEHAAPYLPFGPRFAMSNLWLTRPLITRVLLSRSLTASMLRTTTAPTIFNAGTKDNVLPPTARAVVNFRIKPGETVASVTDHVRALIADPEVKVSALGFSSDPSPVSSIDGPAFGAIRRTIRETLGDAPPPVLPFLVMGGTDARYWSRQSSVAYRFSPFLMEEDATRRAHGTDERLSITSFVKGIRFYVQLIRNAQALP